MTAFYRGDGDVNSEALVAPAAPLSRLRFRFFFSSFVVLSGAVDGVEVGVSVALGEVIGTIRRGLNFNACDSNFLRVCGVPDAAAEGVSAFRGLVGAGEAVGEENGDCAFISIAVTVAKINIAKSFFIEMLDVSLSGLFRGARNMPGLAPAVKPEMPILH
jgi:hypothetical protein